MESVELPIRPFLIVLSIGLACLLFALRVQAYNLLFTIGKVIVDPILAIVSFAASSTKPQAKWLKPVALILPAFTVIIGAAFFLRPSDKSGSEVPAQARQRTLTPSPTRPLLSELEAIGIVQTWLSSRNVPSSTSYDCLSWHQANSSNAFRGVFLEAGKPQWIIRHTVTVRSYSIETYIYRWRVFEDTRIVVADDVSDMDGKTPSYPIC